MDSTSVIVIGIDVGGTKIAAGAAVFPEGRIVSRRLTPTGAARGGRAVLDDVIAMARELDGGIQSAGRHVQAVGLGICELVDSNGRLSSANCIDWLDLPVVAELSSIAPARIDADVRAAALAEFHFGAGRAFRNFLYVTVGTGISCCLMLEGTPFLGAHGITGTMASSPLSLPCESCGCGSRRTLEEIASGPALVSRFNALGGRAESGQDVLAAMAAGNTDAARVVETAGEALGSMIGILVSTLDPEAVVLGGGLGLVRGPFCEQVVTSTRRHIWSEKHRDRPILPAETGADAGWLGAAAAAWRTFKTDSPRA